MWKATNIEIIKNIDNNDGHSFYFTDCYTLKINDVQISNCITDKLTIDSPNYFQNSVCQECGHSCDAGGYLSIVRHEKSLWFIPCFDETDGELLEYNGNDVEGNYGWWDCPPHAWYEHGILEVDEVMLPDFLRILTGFDLSKIPFIENEEINKVLEWERLVKEKPLKGFMRL